MQWFTLASGPITFPAAGLCTRWRHTLLWQHSGTASLQSIYSLSCKYIYPNHSFVTNKPQSFHPLFHRRHAYRYHPLPPLRPSPCAVRRGLGRPAVLRVQPRLVGRLRRRRRESAQRRALGHPRRQPGGQQRAADLPAQHAQRADQRRRDAAAGALAGRRRQRLDLGPHRVQVHVHAAGRPPHHGRGLDPVWRERGQHEAGLLARLLAARRRDPPRHRVAGLWRAGHHGDGQRAADGPRDDSLPCLPRRNLQRAPGPRRVRVHPQPRLAPLAHRLGPHPQRLDRRVHHLVHGRQPVPPGHRRRDRQPQRLGQLDCQAPVLYLERGGWWELAREPQRQYPGWLWRHDGGCLCCPVQFLITWPTLGTVGLLILLYSVGCCCAWT